jgi:two-component system cell cycle response regulator
MSLRLKFNLVLAGVLLLAVLGAGAYVHRFLQQSAIEEVQHNSQIMMHAAMAIRDYTTELVKPHLDVTLAENPAPDRARLCRHGDPAPPAEPVSGL